MAERQGAVEKVERLGANRMDESWKELQEFYQGKRVLVTGHTGFKGSWMCRLLEKLGAKVSGYSLAPPTDPALFDVAGLEDTMESYTGDVRDFRHLLEVFETVKPEVVFHLAAQPIVKILIRNQCTPMKPMLWGLFMCWNVSEELPLSGHF